MSMIPSCRRMYAAQRKTVHRCSMFLTVFCCLFSGAAAQPPRAIPSDTIITLPVAEHPDDTVTDTTAKLDTSSVADTAVADSGAPRTGFPHPDTSSATAGSLPADASPDDSASPEAAPSVPHGNNTNTLPPATIEDSTGLAAGNYFSAGIGWTIGDFELLSLWENALPDSFPPFHVYFTSDDSSGTPVDGDSLRISFAVKEAPSVYTMSFPLLLTYKSIHENHQLALSLSGSWMRKVFTGVFSTDSDTLPETVDIKETVNIYTVLLSFRWGHSIPAHYFSVEGMEKTFFTAGIDIAPFVGTRIGKSASTAGDKPYLLALKRSFSSSIPRFFHGGAVGGRFGISMIKRLNARSATDFGLFYTIRGYGYFFEKGNRVFRRDIDPSTREDDRPLFWISNRLELSFSLLRRFRR